MFTLWAQVQNYEELKGQLWKKPKPPESVLTEDKVTKSELSVYVMVVC